MYEYRFVAESEAESLSREVNASVREGWEFVKVDVSVSAAPSGGAKATLLLATLQRLVRTGSTMHPEFDPEDSVRPGAPDNFSGGSDSLPDLLSR